MNNGLSKDEIERYARHFVLPGLGQDGQIRLKNSAVLVVGAGGLGAPILLYLAAAGIGTIGIVDHDTVELSNLQRQVLYSDNDTGQSKAELAAAKIKALNPHIEVKAYTSMLDSTNALDILNPYQVVVDGTDNFPTRYLLNDACVILGKPLVYGSIHQFEGQVAVFNYEQNGHRSGNYRDLYPQPPTPNTVPNCAEGGVLGVLPGIIGSMQANEVIKICTGIGSPLAGQLLLYDALTGRSRIMKFDPQPDTPKITTLIDYQAFCGLNKAADIPEISVQELYRLREAGNDPNLIDVREPYEYDIANIGGQLASINKPERIEHLLDAEKPNVLHCRSGARSGQQVERLIQKYPSYTIKNLKGGILAWINEIDPSLTRY